MAIAHATVGAQEVLLRQSYYLKQQRRKDAQAVLYPILYHTQKAIRLPPSGQIPRKEREWCAQEKFAIRVHVVLLGWYQ